MHVVISTWTHWTKDDPHCLTWQFRKCVCFWQLLFRWGTIRGTRWKITGRLKYSTLGPFTTYCGKWEPYFTGSMIGMLNITVWPNIQQAMKLLCLSQVVIFKHYISKKHKLYKLCDSKGCTRPHVWAKTGNMRLLPWLVHMQLCHDVQQGWTCGLLVVHGQFHLQRYLMIYILRQ